MARSSSQLKEQIDEVLKMAFVGLWIRQPNNEFVSLDDKFDVLRDDLKKDILSLLKSAVRDAKTGMLRKCIDLVGEDYEDETQRVSLPAEVVATLKKPGYNPTHESIPVKGAAIRNQYRLSLRDALFQLEEALEEGGDEAYTG